MYKYIKFEDGTVGLLQCESIDIKYVFNQDPIKLLNTVADFYDENKNKYDFSDLNISMNWNIPYDKNYIREYKEQIVHDSIEWLRYFDISFKFKVLDTHKVIPNAKTIIERLDKTVIKDINNTLKSKGFKNPIVLDTESDYPLNLKSDYRGDTISAYIRLQSNKDSVNKTVSNFNTFAKSKLQQFVSKDVSDIKITEIESDDYSCGFSVIALCKTKFNFDVMYELEGLFEDALRGFSSKEYAVNVQEDTYRELGNDEYELFFIVDLK